MLFLLFRNFILVLFLFIPVMFLFTSCNEESSDPEEKKISKSILRFSIVMTPISESNGIEFSSFTYFPHRNVTVNYFHHFDSTARKNDTLSIWLGTNDTIFRVYPGVKAKLILGISKKWNKEGKPYYINWEFPIKTINSFADSIYIYHFPEDTVRRVGIL